jgi:acetyl-CoA acetyltransferase
MRRNAVTVVGAAETTNLGVIPDLSQIGLHADAALNAMADCGLRPKDIDGIACAATETPVMLAHYLGITPTWIDGTAVGGCSFMIHVRHAAAAIEAGLAKTILITHGESGRSRIGNPARPVPPQSLNGQFEQPYGPMGPPSMFTIPVLRYMKTYGVTEEQIAQVCVVQREWAAKNPRATFKTPISTEDVLNSRMIAWPFRLLMCCLVTDGQSDGGFYLVSRVPCRGSDGVSASRDQRARCGPSDDLRRVRSLADLWTGGSGLPAAG